MRQNPLHYLTDRQIRLLAEAEGLSVAQLFAKYGGLRQRGGASRPAKKRPATSAKRKVARGQVFKNPGKFFRGTPQGHGLYRWFFVTGAADKEGFSPAIALWYTQRGVEASRLPIISDSRGFTPVAEGGVPAEILEALSASSARKNPRTAAQTNASTAMRLYHSGQASSLQEAWDMVREQVPNPSSRGGLGSRVTAFGGPGAKRLAAETLRMRKRYAEQKVSAAQRRWLDAAEDLADRGLGGYEEEILGPYPESPKRRANGSFVTSGRRR